MLPVSSRLSAFGLAVAVAVALLTIVQQHLQRQHRDTTDATEPKSAVETALRPAQRAKARTSGRKDAFGTVLEIVGEVVASQLSVLELWRARPAGRGIASLLARRPAQGDLEVAAGRVLALLDAPGTAFEPLPTVLRAY